MIKIQFISFLIYIILIVNDVQSLNKLEDCQCRISVQSRIIGGRIAKPQSYPWIVSIQWKKVECMYQTLSNRRQNLN